DLEGGGQRLYLALEVLGVEPAAPLRLRRRVRGRHDARAARQQRLQERLDHQRVARVVELELVDAQQARVAELGDRLRHAQRADQVDELLEAQVTLGSRTGLAVGGGEQVRLPDAEPAVEVEAGARLRPARKQAGEAAAPARALPQGRDERAHALQGRALRGVLRQVAGERRRREPRGRLEAAGAGGLGGAEVVDAEETGHRRRDYHRRLTPPGAGGTVR